MPTSERSVGLATDAAGVQTQVTQKNTDGADHFRLASSLYGGHPEDRYVPSTAQAADAVDNTPFGEVDVSSYEGVIFMDTANAASVQLSIDGSTWIAVDAYFRDLGAVDATAEEFVLVNSTAGTGPYLLKTPCKKMRFLNFGAAQASVTFALVGKVGAL